MPSAPRPMPAWATSSTPTCNRRASPGLEKKPVILFGTPTAPSAKSDRPKIVAAGEPRHRIPCTIADLQALDADAPHEVLAEALQAVNGVNLDDHHFEDVVRFGAALQSEHGRLAESQLVLVSDDALAAAREAWLELIGRLEKLDPARVFDARAGALGPVRRLFGGGLTKPSFEQEYSRIKALSQSVEASQPAIEDCVQALDGLSHRYATLSRSLKAHILACRFIVAHIDSSADEDRDRAAHYRSQRDALVARETSLSATAAGLESGRQTLAVLARGLDDFGLSGSGFTREELPAWHAAFSAALLARRMKSQNAGPFDAVGAAHRHLLSKLKRKEAP